MEVTGSPGPERVERACGALPDVRAQQLGGLVAGAEAKGGQLVVGDPEGVDRGCGERTAVEDEHDGVVPWSVRRNPVDAEQGADLDAEAELFAQLAGGRVDRGLVGLGHAAG